MGSALRYSLFLGHHAGIKTVGLSRISSLDITEVFDQKKDIAEVTEIGGMAASGSGFLHHPLLNSFSTSRAQLGKQPWKALGAASALTVVSLTVSKANILAGRNGFLENSTIGWLMGSYRQGISNHVSKFASLSVDPVEEVLEPKTGVVFPGTSVDGRELTGIGLRKKSILGLKSITVYAFGLYADPDSFRSTLSSKYEGVASEELSNKKELFDDVTESDVGLTVRLVIVYGKLKIGSIRSAFEESLGKGLKKFSGEDNKELLGSFTRIFTDDLLLPKGTTIDISRLPGQVLQTRIDGQEIGTVQSPLLCQALFDLYIGDNAFDKPAKETMGLGFASLLSS